MANSTVTANIADIIKVVTFLRDDERCQFWNIIDITGGGLAAARAALRRRLSLPVSEARTCASA